MQIFFFFLFLGILEKSSISFNAKITIHVIQWMDLNVCNA